MTELVRRLFKNPLANVQRIDSLQRMDTPLDQQIQAILDRHKGDWPAIAQSAGVSYSWLSKFTRGHIKNPGYRTLRRIELSLQRAQAVPTTPSIET